MQIGQAQCLAELGRLDDARKVAADMWAMLPMPPDSERAARRPLSRPKRCWPTSNGPCPREERGDIAAAKAELDRIATRRPKITDIRDGTIMVDRGVAMMGWHHALSNKRPGREFDAVWWDVRDAQK
jgi:hypothetical protein